MMWMARGAMVAWLTAVSPALADDAGGVQLLGSAESASMRVYPWVEVPIIVGSASVIAGYRLGGGNEPWDKGPVEIETDTPQWSEGASAASDEFLFAKGGLYGITGVLAGAFIGAAYGPPGGTWGEGLGVSAVVTMESVGLTGAATDLLKYNINRPRPFTSEAFQDAYPEVYDSEAVQEELEASGGDAYLSMPSGHTSYTAATFFNFATIWLIHELDAPRGNRKGRWVLPVTAELVAVGSTYQVARLRVEAGRHHPSDVRLGAVIGTAIGVGVPLVHYAMKPKKKAEDRAVRLRLQGTGLALSGAL